MRVIVIWVLLPLAVGVGGTQTTEELDSAKATPCSGEEMAHVCLEDGMDEDDASLLQLKLNPSSNIARKEKDVFADIDEEEDGPQDRSLLSARSGRTGKGFSISKVGKSISKGTKSVVKDSGVSKVADDATKTVSDGVNDAVDSTSDALKEATKQATTWVDNQINSLKSGVSSTVDTLLKQAGVDCIKKGIETCVKNVLPMNTMKTYYNAAKAMYLKAMDVMKPTITAMSSLAKNVKCSATSTLTVPTAISLTWTPKITMTDVQVCTKLTYDMTTLKSLWAKFKAVMSDLYEAAAGAISSSYLKLTSGCECAGNFGFFLGATIGFQSGKGIAGAGGAGFIVGCDGCKFRSDPFWTASGGLSTNTGVSAGVVLGVANKYDNFWGHALSANFGADLSLADIGANASTSGVTDGIPSGIEGATTLPGIEIETKTQTIQKKICVGTVCGEVKKNLGSWPTGVKFTAPELATVSVAWEEGVSSSKVDAGCAYAYAEKISM